MSRAELSNLDPQVGGLADYYSAYLQSGTPQLEASPASQWPAVNEDIRDVDAEPETIALASVEDCEYAVDLYIQKGNFLYACYYRGEALRLGDIDPKDLPDGVKMTSHEASYFQHESPTQQVNVPIDERANTVIEPRITPIVAVREERFSATNLFIPAEADKTPEQKAALKMKHAVDRVGSIEEIDAVLGIWRAYAQDAREYDFQCLDPGAVHELRRLFTNKGYRAIEKPIPDSADTRPIPVRYERTLSVFQQYTAAEQTLPYLDETFADAQGFPRGVVAAARVALQNLVTEFDKRRS